MVDELRVRRLLRAATDEIATLRDESRADQARRADRLWFHGIKYAFIATLEACMDVAQHLCATEG